MNTNRTKSISTSKMAMGESVTGSIVDVKDGKYGPIYVLNVGGNDVDLFPSGNLKFLASDLESGKRQLNTPYTITRIADKTIKGYPVSQFTINAANETAEAKTNVVADKLAAIRAKRVANGTNTANS